jgi:hypothetical protein
MPKFKTMTLSTPTHVQGHLPPYLRYREAMLALKQQNGANRASTAFTSSTPPTPPCQFKALLACPTLVEIKLSPSPDLTRCVNNPTFHTANNGEVFIVRGQATTGTDVLWATRHGRILALSNRELFPNAKRVCFIPNRYEDNKHFGSAPRIDYIN